MKPQKGYYNEAYDQENLLDEQPDDNEQPRTVNNDNNNGNDVIVGENVQQQAATEKDPYAGTRSYIQELIDASKQRDKDLQREQRMSRAHEAIAGIADMGRALSNLYFTNQYSPNAFEESGLTDKERARWEKARAEREQNRTNIMNYHMMQGKLDDAERQWKYKQERDKVADERYQKRLDVEEKRYQEKKKEAKVAANNAIRKDNWTSQILNGEFEMAVEEADLQAQYENGEIDAYEYNEALKALKAAEAAAKKTMATRNYNRTTSTRSTGGGGRGSNNYKYIAFADGSGVNINKNDDASITSIYNDASFPEDYKARDKYGRVKEKPTAQDKRDAVENYLKNNRNERYENWLRQAEKRQRTPTAQANPQKRQNPMNNGKKANPMG